MEILSDQFSLCNDVISLVQYNDVETQYIS